MSSLTSSTTAVYRRRHPRFLKLAHGHQKSRRVHALPRTSQGVLEEVSNFFRASDPDLNRYPQPGSRPEKYSTPSTKASDPAQNPYWKRDVRRAYPQLSVVTQSDLSTLLIQHSQPQCVAAPKEGEAAQVPTKALDVVGLTHAIFTVASETPIYNEAKLPPKVPTLFRRWRPERAPDAPHDPNAYFPMLLYK
ncbi:hypothetical protein JVU11DRAFT_2360 [Chiua virens]|nr:hypothetical protein JVU11DRAFT_2360 [Chiua virens]